MTKKEQKTIINHYKNLLEIYLIRYHHKYIEGKNDITFDELLDSKLKMLDFEELLKDLKIEFQTMKNELYTYWCIRNKRLHRIYRELYELLMKHNLNYDITNYDNIENYFDDLKFINLNDYTKCKNLYGTIQLNEILIHSI